MWGFGERVVAEVAMTGTQKTAYQGIQPSKSPVVLHQLDIYRFNPDGKVIDITSYGSSQEYTATGQSIQPGQSGQSGEAGQSGR